MILKIFRTSLTQFQRSPILKGSAFLFSNDPNQKGFKGFNRRKPTSNANASSPQQNKKEQKQQKDNQNNLNQFQSKNDTKPEDVSKIQSTQNDDDKSANKPQGSHRFTRRSRPKSQLKQINSNPDPSKQQSAHNFKEQQNTQKQQQTQANPKSQGQFSNFARRKKQPIPEKQLYKAEQRKQAVGKSSTNTLNSSGRNQSNPKQQQQNPDHVKNQAFSKFVRTKKPTNPTEHQIKSQTKKQQTKLATKQNQSLDAKSSSQKQQHKQNLKNQFDQFKPSNNKIQQQSQTKKEQSKFNNTINQPVTGVNDIKKQEQQAQQKPQKTAEQLERQRLQQQQNKKQEYFKQKILQFKQLKQNQPEPNKLKNQISDMVKRIEKKILQLTGIDVNYQMKPPKSIENNPMLKFIFRIFTNAKLIFIALLGLSFFQILSYLNTPEDISSQEILRKIEAGEVFRIIFEESQQQADSHEIDKKIWVNAIVVLKNGQVFKSASNSQFQMIVKTKVALINSLTPTMPPIIVQNTKYQDTSHLRNVRTILSLTMLYFFVSSLMGSRKTGGTGSAAMFTQAKSKKFQQKVNVKFNDVVGMQKAKEQIIEFIDFLRHPKKYHDLGAKIPRGALLTGPPGTGKTMIAKACAGQSNVPFFTISGSQFIEMYVGVGAQRVRDLFKQAKQAAPSIIFIDEIDAVGKKRSSGLGGGNDERDNTLNQLLVEMDGFKTGEDVIVFAATNQRQVLDPALVRPGRFDRLVQIDLPDIEGRKEIFMVHLQPIAIDQQSTIQDYARRMATLTPGFSGAEIKNLCNQAAIMAARNGNKFVTMHDFQLATERVIGGVEKKSHLITPQTRRIVAYHQCGHGVASWFLQGANPLLKLTIIPRSKGSLGFAQYLPHQTQMSTKRQLEDSISVILAGRVTEQIFFGKISTGAYDDLQKAYNIAKKIVTQYGMNQQLGWLSFEQTQYAKHYSKETQKKIDEEITKIIKNCTQRTRSLIHSKKQLIEKLASKLLEVETVDLTQISDILGPRPFKANKQYEEYLKEYQKLANQHPQQPKDQQNNLQKGAAMKQMKQGRFSRYLL